MTESEKSRVTPCSLECTAGNTEKNLGRGREEKFPLGTCGAETFQWSLEGGH